MKQMIIVGGADESSKFLIISIETAELRMKRNKKKKWCKMRDEKEDIMKGSRTMQQKQGISRMKRLKMWAEEDETRKKV